MEKKHILSAAQVAMKLRRIAYEVLENNPGEQHLVLAGIRGSGLIVARQLQSILMEIAPIRLELVTLSFDKKNPSEISVSGATDFNDKVVIIIDDVTNSGKALLYALKPFLQQYPRKIQTLALVERSHKSYPIHADYVGLKLATTLQEHVHVEVEGDLIKGAYLD